MVVLKHIRIFNGVNECDIYLIGTAHVSKDSVEAVEKIISVVSPDGIAVELVKAGEHERAIHAVQRLL